jgi:Ca2+-transporting ATPase
VGGRDGWPVDALVIAAIVVLNAILGYVEEARAESAVAALQKMSTVNSSVLRNGRLLRIPSEDLVTGDLLVLGEGDAVGADARLIEAAALRVQEASLTGESTPAPRPRVLSVTCLATRGCGVRLHSPSRFRLL